MSLVDLQNLIWSSKALTATALSDNSIDSGGALLDPSVGEPMCFVISVEVAAKVSGGTETYEFDLVQSSTEDLATSADILCAVPFTNGLAASRLTAGAQVVLPIPPGSITKQYYGISFVGANTPTITVSARLCAVKDVAVQKYFPKAYTVTS